MFSEMVNGYKKACEQEMSMKTVLEFAQSMDQLLDEYREMVHRQTEALESIEHTLDGIRTDNLIGKTAH